MKIVAEYHIYLYVECRIRIRAKVYLNCFIIDFCLPSLSSLQRYQFALLVNGPLNPAFLLQLTQDALHISSLISIERRSSVRVIVPPFWAKTQRIRSRWLYGGFFIASHHHSSSIIHRTIYHFQNGYRFSRLSHFLPGGESGIVS